MKNDNNHNKNFKFIYIVGLLIIAFNVSSPFCGNVTINLGFLTDDGTILLDVIPFCIANFLLDIFTNQYGWQNSKRLIYLIIISRIIVASILWMFIYSTHLKNIDTNYMHLIIKGLFSGVVAGYVSFMLNCYIFSYLYNYSGGKFIWVRCIVATSIGELVYSLISNFMYLSHIYTVQNILAITLHINVFMWIFEIVTLPLIYLLIGILDIYEKPYKIRNVNFSLDT